MTSGHIIGSTPKAREKFVEDISPLLTICKLGFRDSIERKKKIEGKKVRQIEKYNQSIQGSHFQFNFPRLSTEFASEISDNPSESAVDFKNRILDEIDSLERKEKEEDAADAAAADAALDADIQLREIKDGQIGTLAEGEGVVAIVHEHDILEKLVKRNLKEFDARFEENERRKREE